MNPTTVTPRLHAGLTGTDALAWGPTPAAATPSTGTWADERTLDVVTRADPDHGTESGLKGYTERVDARRDSQVWPTAQRSGRCPVGVRRFKSCSLHSTLLRNLHNNEQ
jgi:hypothetical protein